MMMNKAVGTSKKMAYDFVIENEDRLRTMVANGRREELKREMNQTFIKKVFEIPHNLVDYVDESPDELSVPHFLTVQRDATSGPQLVQDRATFQQRFNAFTGNLLNGLDWSNVVAAGGCVLASATTNPNRDTLYATSDIDLFLYGLKTDDEANAKLREIYSVVARNTPNGEKPMVLRTGRAVSFIGTYPTRTVQVILRLYTCPAEVLLGFDIDCCAFAYDGTDLFASDRSLYSVSRRVNIVNSSRRSTSYETRLIKYSKRGFAIVIPGLDVPRIDDSTVRLTAHSKQKGRPGLLRLLALIMSSRMFRPATVSTSQILGTSIGRREANPFADKIRDEVLEAMDEPSDYSAIVVPWGPRWNASTIKKVLDHRDKAEFFAGEHNKQREGFTGTAPTHMHCFVTGLDEAIQGVGTSAWCMKCKRHESLCGDTSNAKYVAGPLRWERELACFQDVENGKVRIATGSFCQSLTEPYDQGVYLKEPKSFNWFLQNMYNPKQQQPRPTPFSGPTVISTTALPLSGTFIPNPFSGVSSTSTSFPIVQFGTPSAMFAGAKPLPQSSVPSPASNPSNTQTQPAATASPIQPNVGLQKPGFGVQKTGLATAGWGGGFNKFGARTFNQRGNVQYTEEQMKSLGDFPNLTNVPVDTVACMRAVSSLKKKGLLSDEVNDFIRDALVCDNRSVVVPFANALNAYAMPDFFSLDDLSDALKRIYRLGTSSK